MKIKLLILAIMLLVISSCNNQSEKSSNPISEKEPSLHLNAGKKWLANKETDNGMHNLKVLLDTISSSPDYTFLVQSMQKETQYIITNCNMTGEEHNQLHLVLYPILSSINEIKDAKQDEIRNNGIAEIQTNLEDYFNHFETN